MVSWSMSSVSTTRHISTRCCQSRLLRAKRETSQAATAPTLPRHTSGDHALEAGAQGAAGGRASEILVDDLDLCEAELGEALAPGVREPLALAVVLDLMRRGLADVEHGFAGAVLRADLLSVHRRRPRLGRPAPGRRRRRARRAGGSEGR